MKTILDDMERALTDLLQMGLSTAGADMAKLLRALSEQCDETGFHTGAGLFDESSRLLEQRSHTMAKTDRALAGAICRAEHYITLCRSRMTEEEIQLRWQEGGKT